ncbi:hypothetical protein [Aquimarina sediminis]|uniref:hypothetical protein n=1 Tax=Aquimarina sediminis TaxID=2070536 RepID=UPI000CA07C3D|nr:hypothetical protein [Aquimarina sediminis]
MELKEQKQKVDLSYYLGTWRNSYEKARLIGEFTFFEKDGVMQIRIKNSKDSFYKSNWDIAPVRPHSYAPEINDVVAFQAHLKMEEMEAFLAINENKGLLIIAGYLTFDTNDERSDCFVREFFYKV